LKKDRPKAGREGTLAHFVLVHGACHGAWCWARLIPELETLGHKATAIDLPSLGEDNTPIPDVTFDMTIGRVVDVLEQQPEPVLLVGHSLGGVSITAAAERAPETIGRLVYLTALLPSDGQTVDTVYASPNAFPETPDRSAVRTPDGLSYYFVPENARRRFYHDVSDEDFAFAMAHLKPQPTIMRTSVLNLTPERYGRVKRAYIHCTDDRSIAIALQREMVARNPCDPVVTMTTSHSPFLSAPKKLAGVLDDIASR
jgi:pimeloyl-ACP methyl ester carboxylesterase